MTDQTSELPPLTGVLSRADLLGHLIAGNVLGYVVSYGAVDRLDFESHTGIGALGKAVIARCAEINAGIPEAEMELGTDLSFCTVDDDVDATDFDDEVDPDFAAALLPLTIDDAKYLLAHMPAVFLRQLTAEE